MGDRPRAPTHLPYGYPNPQHNGYSQGDAFAQIQDRRSLGYDPRAFHSEHPGSFLTLSHHSSHLDRPGPFQTTPHYGTSTLLLLIALSELMGEYVL